LLSLPRFFHVRRIVGDTAVAGHVPQHLVTESGQLVHDRGSSQIPTNANASGRAGPAPTTPPRSGARGGQPVGHRKVPYFVRSPDRPPADKVDVFASSPSSTWSPSSLKPRPNTVSHASGSSSIVSTFSSWTCRLHNCADKGPGQIGKGSRRGC